MSDAERRLTAKNRRRKKLIRLDLQLKIVFITLFVASLVLLINFQLALAGLWSMSNHLGEGSNAAELLESVKRSTIQRFLFSVAIAVPLAGFVGILYSFKFCGPIYRFKRYFTGLRDGRWDDRCMLRKGDDLQDVAQVINEGVGVLRGRIRENHEILLDVNEFLSKAALTSDSDSREILAEIRERIRTEQSSFVERFPADGVTRRRRQVELQAEGAVSQASSSAGEEADVASVEVAKAELREALRETVCEREQKLSEKESELEGQV